MHLLQACWCPSGKLYIWSESSELYQKTYSQNLLAVPSDNNHPFIDNHEKLTEILDELEFDPDDKEFVDFLLPTEKGCPLPSLTLSKLHPVSDETVNIEDDASLTSWKVPCLVLDPLSSIAFLSSLPSNLPQNYKFADSFLIWVESTKLLLDLIAHGRILPVLVRSGSHYLANWQVIINQEEDLERLNIISKAVPQLCLFKSKNSSDTSNSNSNLISPSKLIHSFLTSTADRLVRMFLKSTDLYAEELPTTNARKNIFFHQAANSWLKALSSEDSKIDTSAHELLKLEEKLIHWSSKILSENNQEESAFGIAFQVISPEGPEDLDDAVWEIDILLKSNLDEKKYLHSEQLFNGELGFLENVKISPEKIEETLLEELGKCITIFPKLKIALDSPIPKSLKLNTEEAWQFLKHTSLILEKQGFSVIAPSWWNSTNNKLGLHLELDAPDQSQGVTKNMLGMNQLVDFSWSISLGDEKLSVDEFQKILKKQNKLVFVGSQWVEIEQEVLEKTFNFLESQSKNNKMKLLQALRFGFGLGTSESTLPVVGFSATGWVDNLLNSQDNKLLIDKEINNFKGELRPYQKQGLAWLYFLSQVGIGGCLADDMGLGKTVQFLALLQLEREVLKESLEDGSPQTENQIKRILPTLLIVPMSILENWRREAEKFAPQLNVYIHHGQNRLIDKELKKKILESDLVLTTYSLSHRDENCFNQFSWGRIALDEAQNIKNVNTKQSKAIRALVEQQLAEDRVDTQAIHRIALTGTPLENHLDELWSIFDFLNPSFLGKLSDFRSNYSLAIERYRDKAAAEALSKLIEPFILRRLKSQPEILSDLPDKIEMDVYTSLSPEQAALYQKVVDDMVPSIDRLSGIHRKGLVLSSLTKLKQICNHPELYLKENGKISNRSGKLDRLEELLEVILAEGDKTLIFTQYAKMGAILQKHLAERFNQEILFLHGGLNQKARSKQIDRFQEEKNANIFILSLKAGGFGLNLTEANQVIHYDQWWNPAAQEQATDRAYRIGQKKNVQVRKFICKGTLEEKISSLLSSKKELAESIVGTARSTITEMSADELRNLLQLSNIKKAEETLSEKAL